MPTRREQAAAQAVQGAQALERRDFAAARASLEAAVALDPAWAESRTLLARAHLGLGDRDLAERTVRMAVEADPRHAASAHLLGTLLCERDRFVEAMPWLQA